MIISWGTAVSVEWFVPPFSFISAFHTDI